MVSSVTWTPQLSFHAISLKDDSRRAFMRCEKLNLNEEGRSRHKFKVQLFTEPELDHHYSSSHFTTLLNSDSHLT